MNGIVHPCIHPDGKVQPKTEEQMFDSVFKYLDRIFSVVRPRKLIYFAFDGVAPRAKMNQQRARRFQSIKEKEKVKIIEEEYRTSYSDPSQLPEYQAPFDSNVISPGTEFMMRLMKACEYYIHLHSNFDQGWKNIKVVFSGCEVPGEGEHKVINFIKTQRSQTGYDPNTKHVMVGLDADLIFLSLVTHEPYFYILREQIFRGAKGRSNFEFLNCSILRDYLRREFKELPNVERSIDDFIFMCILVGNDFLPRLPSLEIQEGAIDALISTYKFSFNKMGGYICDAGKIDYARLEEFLTRIGEMENFVFSVRLKKSDYLAYQREKNVVKIDDKEGKSPTRERVEFIGPVVHITQVSPETTEQQIYEMFIACGQIDQLVYPFVNQKPKGYALLSFVEDSSIEKAIALSGQVLCGKEIKVALKKNAEKKKKEWKELFVGNFPLTATRQDLLSVFAKFGEIEKMSLPETDHKGFCFIEFKTTDGYEACLNTIKDGDIKILDAVIRVSPSNERSQMDDKTRKYQKGLKKLIKTKLGVKMGDHPDMIRLGDETDIGWRKRYYNTNFGLQHDVKDIVKEYLEGLAWVTQYYFQGCPSWSWFYPYHYAPMASDMKGLKYDFKWDPSSPFKPFHQLLAILPPGSRHALPKAYHKLFDKDSEIVDFYPSEWKVDLVGVKMEYKGVVILPFIDEQRLLKAAKSVEDDLTQEELVRNAFGHNHLYFSDQFPLCKVLKTDAWLDIDPNASLGLFGKLYCDKKNLDGLYQPYQTPFKQLNNYNTIAKNRVFDCMYEFPEFVEHKCELLPGLQIDHDLSPESPFLFSFDFDEIGNDRFGADRKVETREVIVHKPELLPLNRNYDLENRVETLEKLLEQEKNARIALEQQLATLEALVLQKLK